MEEIYLCINNFGTLLYSDRSTRYDAVALSRYDNGLIAQIELIFAPFPFQREWLWIMEILVKGMEGSNPHNFWFNISGTDFIRTHRQDHCSSSFVWLDKRSRSIPSSQNLITWILSNTKFRPSFFFNYFGSNGFQLQSSNNLLNTSQISPWNCDIFHYVYLQFTIVNCIFPI